MKTRFLLAASGGVVGGTETYTTPGTYYWTAPAGVTTVDVTGQGGSRDSGTLGWVSVGAPYIFIGSDCGGVSPTSSTLSYSTLISLQNAQVSAVNAVTTSTSGASYSTLNRVRTRLWCNATSLWVTGSEYTYGTGIFRRVGTFSTNATLSGLSGNVPINPVSTIYNSTGGTLYKEQTTYTYGTNSTAFGIIFSNNSPQKTTTGISVTPGTVYTIVVGVDEGADTAFVSFDYY